jgi:hypothetical protein
MSPCAGVCSRHPARRSPWPNMDYLDFDLLIERLGDHYRARVTQSPAGEAAGEFTSPFSPLELENLVLRLGQARGRRTLVPRSSWSSCFAWARRCPLINVDGPSTG